MGVAMRDEYYAAAQGAVGGEGHSIDIQAWQAWQNEIVTLLQQDFGAEALRHIGLDDIDWPSWQCFYIQGKTARAAIDRALERDL